MFGSTILDVGIGLIFVFLLMSLICTAVNEIIEQMLKRRATDLERGIRELLHDKKGEGLAAKLYNHPFVYSLFQGDYSKDNIKAGVVFRTTPGTDEGGTYRTKEGSELPSYIPARVFALTLMDIFLPAAGATKSGTSGATAPTPVTTTKTETGPAGAITKKEETTIVPSTDTSTNLRLALTVPLAGGGAAAVPGAPEVQKVLLALIDAAGGDANKARENIENWYDSAMDRVSGWYKRRAQRCIFFVGLAAAVFMNVDTIGITRALAADKNLRDAVVKRAETYVEDQRKAEDAKNAAEQKVDDAKKAGGKAPEAVTKEAADAEKALKAAEARLDKARKELDSLSLPIGWRADPYADVAWLPVVNDGGEGKFARQASTLVFRLPGWLLTAFAVSLGSAFWFDLLNKIMVIRSTVKPHEKSPEEGSEDHRPGKGK